MADQMADVPFLGCKISLISKCDIRYEGILYSVDAKESTIALSKVRSYGTETRGDPNCFVAPKNDIYDIIIFRASDVKDLRVDAPQPPVLQDPAIISYNHSYSSQTASTSSFNNINSSSNNTTTTGAPTLNSNGSLSTSGPSNQQNKQHQKPLLPFLPTGSKEHNQQQQIPINNYSTADSNAQRRQRPDPRDKRTDELGNKRQETNRDSLKRGEDRRPEKREERRDDRRDDRRGDERREDRRDDRRPERRFDERRADDRRGVDRRGDVDRRNDRREDTGRRGDGRPRMSRGMYDNNRDNLNSHPRPNQNRNFNSRRGPMNRDENSKGGPYRGGPMHGRRARSGDRIGAPRGPRKGAQPLKFDNEFDFDESNKIFLELEGKFKGMKIKGEEKEESSGEGPNLKSPAGQSEFGSGYDSEDQNKDGDSKDGYGGSVSGEFYDKTKSFFDNISCEASERSQGKVNKPNWRMERQLNAETFGVSANYRRGGYRGRSYGMNSYHRR